MKNKKRVLIAYEDKEAADRISILLKDEECETVLTSSGSEAERLAGAYCPDIILLGVTLEDKDGIAVLRSLRRWSGLPVIVFSSCLNESLMLEALVNGADDYMIKPFSFAQLMLRMKLVMRHYFTSNDFRRSSDRYMLGDLVVDFDEQRAFVGGRDAKLTKSEFRIVALLAKHHGSVCTYEYIISQLWGPNLSDNNQILRVNMAKIRKKLEDKPSHPRYIFTQPGVGYRMAEE